MARLKVEQTKSTLGRKANQRNTLRSLGLKRIDISNRIFKTDVMDKESVYFAFPFAIDDTDPLYEITGGTTTQSAPPGPRLLPPHVRHPPLGRSSGQPGLRRLGHDGSPAH